MRLAKIFSNGMVLQRNKPIKVFGTGKGEVTVSFLGDTVTLVTDKDNWQVELPAHCEGGPYAMSVCMDGATVEIKDIWIGEVWITSGQSNMSFMFWEMYRRGVAVTDFDENDNLHYFRTTVDGNLNYDESNSGWVKCNKNNIMNIYAMLPYYFALKLQKKLDGIHVAVLNASRGWTRIESWIPAKYIDGTDLDLDRSIKKLAPSSDIPNGRLFEGYVRPFVPYVTNGLIWYQGESNSGIKECEYYSGLLELLISGWRKEFEDELPVLLVQLTGYGAGVKKDASIEEKCEYNDDSQECCWAKIREQQTIASKKIKDVYMVTTIDTGEFYEIHPTGKDIIAERLAVAANNIISNENDEYSGPIFESMRIEGKCAIITFSHAEKLYTDENLDYICISGGDGVYYPAKHKVVNNELVVYSDKVLSPKNVKYAFCNWACGGIFNEVGFPASSFRTSIPVCATVWINNF